MGELVAAVIVVAAIGFSIFIVVRHNRLRSKNDDLLAGGVAAKATVTRLRPVAGEEDLFTLALDVERPGSSPQPVETDLWVPVHALPSVQPGKTVSVRHDPANVARLVLDLKAMGLA